METAQSELKLKEIRGELALEPILETGKNARFALFPIKHQDLWDLYKQAEASFWTAEEIDLESDRADWEKLNGPERHFLSHVLAFFANSDNIVIENLVANFCSEVQIPEARSFYTFQGAIENIHAETYGLLIEKYIREEETKATLFNAIDRIPCVQKKAEWAMKYMNPDVATFAERLVAFAIVEGIFFSASFCAIFWMKKRGLMPGLTFSNELISRDEALHTEFACVLYRKLVNQLPDKRIHEIMQDAVQIEVEFATEALPVNLIGMNNMQMIQFVKFCADRLLGTLGAAKIYKQTNPFDWMELISLQGKTNFFESRNSSYSLANVGVDAEDNKFSLDKEF